MKKHVRHGKRLRAKLRPPSITITTPKPGEADAMLTVGVDFGVSHRDDTETDPQNEPTDQEIAEALRAME